MSHSLHYPTKLQQEAAEGTTTAAGIKSFSMNNNNYKMLLKGIHLQMVSWYITEITFKKNHLSIQPIHINKCITNPLVRKTDP